MYTAIAFVIFCFQTIGKIISIDEFSFFKKESIPVLTATQNNNNNYEKKKHDELINSTTISGDLFLIPRTFKFPLK